MTQIKKKKRSFKNRTPGQERDFEILSARRMFQAYEEDGMPANHTGVNIAGFDPVLGKPAKVMYKRKRRKLDMEFNANKVDGRTKSYKEAVRRIKERQERMKERQSNDNNTVNNIALQAANPFGNEVDEAIPIHTPKNRAAIDAAIKSWKDAGGKTTKLPQGKPIGMDKRRKKLKKQLNQEDIEMKNKYLKIKPGSIEDAALSSLLTAAGENPNDYRPTLHLPEKKYLQTKEGSLERAVEEAMTEKHKPGHGQKSSIGTPLKHKRSWNPATHKLITLPNGSVKVVKKNVPGPEAESVEHDVENMIQFGKPFTVGEKLSAVDQATMAHAKGDTAKRDAILQNRAKAKAKEKAAAKKSVDEDDDRRTVDAIRAYDKSKDASRDADWDTVHGKIKQGKKEKKYAKKERGEIDKDDPNWKHRSYHTGMHGEDLETEQHAGQDYYKKRAARWKMGELGPRDAPKKKQEKSAPKGSTAEETEMSPMIRATIDKIHSMREDKLSYKERQKLPSGDFALPGKGDGPEGKQGGSYPIPDESHARNALARVSQHGSEAEKRKVKSAVAKKFPEIKIGEAKDRGIGTDAYANYVKGITPGQEPDAAITGNNAKKNSVESKKATDEKARNAGLEDEYIPTLEEYSTHLESLEGEALETELETLDQNELLEILGTGLVKKAAGAIKKRFSAQGRLAAAKKKGAKIQAKTDLATQKTANIAAKAKMKSAREKLRAAKKPKPSGNVDTRKAPGHLAAEYDPTE